MNRLMLVIAVIFMGISASAQEDERTNAVLNQLTEFYNQDKFKELYNQLAPAFQKQQTESTITNFYTNNLKAKLGKISTRKYLGNENGVINYLVTFEKGEQDLKVVLTADAHIAGMLWAPLAAKKILRDLSFIKTSNPKRTELQRYIDTLALAYLQDTATVGLSIGVISGENTEQLFYGETTKGNAVLPTSASIYEIGSISKTFTTMMLAHAVNEGKVALTDDIRKYLPGKYPNLLVQGKPITLLNLANHTSGLPRLPEDFEMRPGYIEQDPYKGYSKEMIYQYLSSFKTDTVSKLSSVYSNFGIAVLGLILENVYQTTLDKQLNKVITGPLQMKNTSYHVALQSTALMTSGYARTTVPYWDMDNFRAAGGLKSNLGDMLLYLQANIKENNKDLGLTHQQTFEQNGEKIGLAWMLQPIGKEQMIWHNGATGGFSSYIGFDKNKNIGVIVLSNSSSGVDEMAQKIIIKLLSSSVRTTK